MPAGPGAAKQAEEVRTRLLNQVDEKRHPRTKATLGQLIDQWPTVLDVEDLTRRSYEAKIRKHIRRCSAQSRSPASTSSLDSFYAELRRCREHCDGRPHTQHRQPGLIGATNATVNPAHRRLLVRAGRVGAPASLHVCKGLSDSSVRQIHWIISRALDRAVTGVLQRIFSARSRAAS